MEAQFIDFPFHLDGRGRSAETGGDDHVRDLIYQVLFTNPGERVNLAGRPEHAAVESALRTRVLDWLLASADVIPWETDSRFDAEGAVAHALVSLLVERRAKQPGTPGSRG